MTTFFLVLFLVLQGILIIANITVLGVLTKALQNLKPLNEIITPNATAINDVLDIFAN